MLGRGVVVVFVLALLVGCGPFRTPGAERDCGQAVISDWADDGSIERTYQAPCYQAALDALPEDLRAYTTAAEDISRALASTRFGS